MRLTIILLFFLFVSQVTWSQAVQSATMQVWKNNGWLTTGRLTNSQDNNGYLMMALTEGFNDSLKTWYNKSRTTYTNNVTGKALFSNDETWNDTTKIWTSTAHYAQTYDSSGNMTSKITYTVKSASSAPYRNFIYRYDTANLLIRDSSAGYISNAWNWNSRTTYTNNSAGSMTYRCTEAFLYSSAWYGINRVFQTYNAKNQITEYIWQTAYLINWNNHYRYLYFYKPDGRLDYYEHYYAAPGVSQNWTFQYKVDFDYHTTDGLDYEIQTKGAVKTQTITGYFPPNTTGLKNSSLPENQSPLYFDMNGRPTDKHNGEVLIELQGTKTRKVLFFEN